MKDIKILLFLLILFLISVHDTFAAISFSITSDNASISESSEIKVNVSVANLTSCSTCYLQAAFTGELENPRYFGFTKNNKEDWFKYEGSPPPERIKSYFYSFEPVSGVWNGVISAKLDTNDVDFKGSGNYFLKVKRYTGESSSGSWSNEIGITVIAPTFSPTPTMTPTEKPKVSLQFISTSPKPTKIVLKAVAENDTDSITPILTEDEKIYTSIAEVNKASENAKMKMGIRESAGSITDIKPTDRNTEDKKISGKLPLLIIITGGMVTVLAGVVTLLRN